MFGLVVAQSFPKAFVTKTSAIEIQDHKIDLFGLDLNENEIDEVYEDHYFLITEFISPKIEAKGLIFFQETEVLFFSYQLRSYPFRGSPLNLLS
ncbi:MAG: hypothetical protein CL678_07650 [Bdellovibrionaceae bacterium]|nr:hypothetical protein [Pseudobdellovibrionaceae bacterium]|tara:strand:- start:140 stop:421 length:282 start_codon:yes stop_codon:yes gene_type:complete